MTLQDKRAAARRVQEETQQSLASMRKELHRVLGCMVEETARALAYVNDGVEVEAIGMAIALEIRADELALVAREIEALNRQARALASIIAALDT